ERGGIVVDVAGEVAHPGVYRFRDGQRTLDAVAAAGGMSADADPVAVNLAAPLADGEELVVPRAGSALDDGALAELGARETPRRSSRSARSRSHRRRAATSGFAAYGGNEAPAPIDLNEADEASLEDVPGLGPALAERIVAYRDLNGAYSSLDDLLDVAGMSPARLERVAPYVRLR
ncbi:MAG: helix-hairpin-helix domain-containing protein, partial [Candidatus Dormibacteria bacterium]